MRSHFEPPPQRFSVFKRITFNGQHTRKRRRRRKEDSDGRRDRGLSYHPSTVVVVVGVSQSSGSTGSSADSLFEPYDVNVLLAANGVYNVGNIPSLVRATRKFLLLPDRLLPPPSLPPRLLTIGLRYCCHWGFPLAAAAEGGEVVGGGK